MKYALLALLFVSVAARADISYEGSSTIADGILADAGKAFEAKTKIKFSKVDKNGSGKAVAAVADGKASFGGLSRPLNDGEKAKVQGLVIGHDAIAIYVHEKNAVQDLTKDQIKEIFTGKITNWKEVGGKDAKIVAISEFKNTTRATLKEFKELALGGAELGAVKEMEFPLDMVKATGKDENAITYASSGFRKEMNVTTIAIGGVKPTPPNVRAEKYPYARPLVLVSKGAPAGEVKQFFDFIMSDDGQTLVSSKFISVK